MESAEAPKAKYATSCDAPQSKRITSAIWNILNKSLEDRVLWLAVKPPAVVHPGELDIL